MTLSSPPEQIQLEPAEAFLAILLVVISSDMYFSEQEHNLVENMIRRMQLFQDYLTSEIEAMFNWLLDIIQAEKSDLLLSAAVAQLPPKLHDTVLANAADLILADGEISTKERELLIKLCKVLQVSKETLTQIIKVMLIKNKG